MNSGVLVSSYFSPFKGIVDQDILVAVKEYRFLNCKFKSLGYISLPTRLLELHT